MRREIEAVALSGRQIEMAVSINWEVLLWVSLYSESYYLGSVSAPVARQAESNDGHG